MRTNLFAPDLVLMSPQRLNYPLAIVGSDTKSSSLIIRILADALDGRFSLALARFWRSLADVDVIATRIRLNLAREPRQLGQPADFASPDPF
jgi:hypothetical protein